jgi:hypothetical protein
LLVQPTTTSFVGDTVEDFALAIFMAVSAMRAGNGRLKLKLWQVLQETRSMGRSSAGKMVLQGGAPSDVNVGVKTI